MSVKNHHAYFSFLDGFCGILNLYERRLDRIRRMYLTKTEAEALASDWEKVGEDMRHAFDKAKCDFDKHLSTCQ